MYDRRHGDGELSFEASGGLIDASLVMRDKETDSWWSIMTGKAIGGKLDGTPLVEMPVGEKTTWGSWKSRYPESKVLSVNGKEHIEDNPYDRYFSSDEGFRGMETSDDRLPGKEAVYVFLIGETAYAIPHNAISGGAAFDIGGGKEVFLYREPGVEVYASTLAYIAASSGKNGRFENEGEKWRDNVTGEVFSEETGFPAPQPDGDTSGDAPMIERLSGFDTFWYIWSSVHKDVNLIQ